MATECPSGVVGTEGGKVMFTVNDVVWDVDLGVKGST